MEPTADGLVEITTDIQPADAHSQPPVPNGAVVEEDAVVIANGHDEAVLDEGDSDLHQMLQALQAVRIGDFTVRLPGNRVGLAGKIADTFNEIVAANERMATQLEYVGQAVGREGRTRQRVRFGLQAGAW